MAGIGSRLGSPLPSAKRVAIDTLLFDRLLALWCEDLEHYTAQRPMPYFDLRDTFGWALKPTLPQLRDWLAACLASHSLDPAETDGFARARYFTRMATAAPAGRC